MNICSDIKIEHRYHIKSCCTLHESLIRVGSIHHHLQGAGAYCGSSNTGHKACYSHWRWGCNLQV